ncbi:MAG: hypothetical protein ACRC2T_00190 [Thermoguttaceae bacterium]
MKNKAKMPFIPKVSQFCFCTLFLIFAAGLMYSANKTCLLNAQQDLNGQQTTPRPDILIADFKGNDYNGWTATGDAFGNGPVSGSNGGGMGMVFGYEGTKLANTFVCPKDDEATGTLTSPEFVIDRKNIVFLIGGGDFPDETGISLLADDKEVRTATGLFNISGQGNEGLRQKSWDVSDLTGKKAKLCILDKRGGNWGHIKVDDIYLVDVVEQISNFNKISLAKDAQPQQYDRMILGQLIEHFHRQIYGGIFEPGSPLADEDGF